MPLPWRKKFYLKYLYKPAFIQQLGIFPSLRNVSLKEILYFLSKKFVLVNIFFNYDNAIGKQLAFTINTNLILNLNKSYSELKETYNKDLRNNLKLGQRENFFISRETEESFIIDLYKKLYQHRTPHVLEEDYKNFYSLCKILKEGNMLFTRSILSVGGEIQAAGIFFTDGRRIYNIMNVTTVEGRKAGVNHFLLDKVLKEFAGKPMIFDFEGSDLKGVAAFYRKFGAVDQPYFHYRKIFF
ncbi:MAG: hypothetical protein NVS1B13_18180 [Flavisolibacter sp.]